MMSAGGDASDPVETTPAAPSDGRPAPIAGLVEASGRANEVASEMATEVEQRWRDLGTFIREQRRRGHMSLRKLSELAGVSNPYLSQIERGLRKPSAEILQQIAGALQISSETLYVQAGILEPRGEEGDLLAEIGRDRWLTEEQKRTLTHIYASFRADNEAAERSSAGGDPQIAAG